MLDTLSTDALTNDILKAIIRRTYTTLRVVEQSDVVELYEGQNFGWTINETHPTLAITFPNATQPEIVYLWWNGKSEDAEMEVLSNIPFTATKNLSYFVSLENLIYSELAEIESALPPRQVMLDDLLSIAEEDGEENE